MHLSLRKILIEVYGLFRLIIGLAMLVAISGGYFMTEMTVRYPVQPYAYVIDKDTLTLVYLAVVIRGLFHVLCGIGFARLQNWVKGWLMIGWPIVLIATGGLILTLFADWQAQGYTASLGEMIAWPPMFLYGCVILIDLIFISSSIKQFNTHHLIDEYGGPLSLKWVGLVALITVLLVVTILFWAKPVHQGFHKGFYKIKGEKSSEGAMVELWPDKELTEESKHLKIGADEKREFIKRTDLAKVEAGPKELNSAVIDDVQHEAKAEQGISLMPIIALLAGVLFIIGLLVQALEIQQSQEAQGASTLTYVFFSISSILLVVYSVSLKQYIFSFLGMAGLIISGWVLSLINNYKT